MPPIGHTNDFDHILTICVGKPTLHIHRKSFMQHDVSKHCMHALAQGTIVSTVEPPIKDPLKKEQPLNNGHISGHQTYGCSHAAFLASERGKPLYKGENLCPQCVSVVQRFHCRSVPFDMLCYSSLSSALYSQLGYYSHRQNTLMGTINLMLHVLPLTCRHVCETYKIYSKCKYRIARFFEHSNFHEF